MKKVYIIFLTLLVTVTGMAQYSTYYDVDFADAQYAHSTDAASAYLLGSEENPTPWIGTGQSIGGGSFWRKMNAEGLTFGDWRGACLSGYPFKSWIAGKSVRFTIGLDIKGAFSSANERIEFGIVERSINDATRDNNPSFAVSYIVSDYSETEGLAISWGGVTESTGATTDATPSIRLVCTVTKSATPDEFNMALVAQEFDGSGFVDLKDFGSKVFTDATLYNSASNGSNSALALYSRTSSTAIPNWSYTKVEYEPSIVLLANAGNAQTVNNGDEVTLTGSASYDGADVTEASYTWTAPEGITLSDVNAAAPTFTAPASGRINTYTFKLTVNANVGGSDQSSDAYVTISANPASTFGGGTGTSGDPYLISNADHLYNLTLSGTTYVSKYFKMTADIDLTGDDNFTPIKDFTGNFNGDMHTITGLNIVKEGGKTAFFEIVKWGGAVNNLGLINANVENTASGETAALVAYLDGNPISNCFVIGGEIKGKSATGGLVGQTANWTGSEVLIVKDCFAANTVIGDAAGGIIGRHNGGANPIAIDNVAFYGETVDLDESGTASGIGSVTISNNTDVVITNSYFVEGSASASHDNETSLTELELAVQANYANFDFATLWEMSSVYDFAVLKGFTYPSTDLIKAEIAKYKLYLGDLTEVIANITLPSTQDDATIVWSSDNETVITTDGTVIRPGDVDTEVTLTAQLTVGATTITKEFKVIVKADTTTTVIDNSNTQINLFPNPVVNTLFISNATEGALVQVYNATGVLMLAKEVTSSKVDIDMSAMPSGIYIVKFENTIQRIVKK